jgi:hypothetical protein
VQKFTRPLTREVEIAGERLALTLAEQGIAVRPVGSRKSPWESSWAKVLCQLAGTSMAGAEPTAAELAEVVKVLKTAPPPGHSAPSPPAEAPPVPAPPETPPMPVAATEEPSSSG